MAILLIAEHDGVHLKDATLKALTGAKKIDADLDIFVPGQGADGAAVVAAAKLAGVRKVLAAPGEALAQGLAEAVALAAAPLAAGYDAIVLPASMQGKDIAPRLAALLDASLISDVLEVVGPKTFVRPIYAGNALETVEASEPKLVITVRASAFPAAGEGGSAAVEIVAGADAAKTTFVGEEKVVSDRPELGAAKIVVSGGRALGSAEEFKAVLEPLADKLGAAIGASRAAVDAGYAPNDYQVGQTGKVVAPDLYIAIGVSGAIQHLAGMKASKVIVAINTDADAPIFGVADYGLVADYKVAVPALLEALNAL